MQSTRSDWFVSDLCFVFRCFFFLSRNKMVATTGNLFRLRRMGVLLMADTGPPPCSLVGRAGSRVEAAMQILSFDASWCSFLLRHFAENVVLCSFNNYPFWLYLSGRAAWAPSVSQRSTTQALLQKMFFLPSVHFIPLFPLSTLSSVPELFSIPLLSFVKWFCPDTSGSGWSALPWERALQPQVASTMNTLLSQFPSCCHGSTFGAAGLLSRTSLIPWYEQKLDLISAFDQITSQQSAVIRKFLCSLYPPSSGLCSKRVAGADTRGRFPAWSRTVHLIYFLTFLWFGEIMYSRVWAWACARVCVCACVCVSKWDYRIYLSFCRWWREVCVRGGCLLPSDTVLCWKVSVFCLSSGNV